MLKAIQVINIFLNNEDKHKYGHKTKRENSLILIEYFLGFTYFNTI